MVNNDLQGLVETRPLKAWKETLALLCTVSAIGDYFDVDPEMLKISNLASLTSHYNGFVKIADSQIFNGVLLNFALGTISSLLQLP